MDQSPLLTFMAEMTHWAGMPYKGKSEQAPHHGYANYYSDPVLAKAGANLGLVMSVDQYRQTYPDVVARHTQEWGSDLAESLLGHGAMNLACLQNVTGLLPKYAKP